MSHNTNSSKKNSKKCLFLVRPINRVLCSFTILSVCACMRLEASFRTRFRALDSFNCYYYNNRRHFAAVASKVEDKIGITAPGDSSLWKTSKIIEQGRQAGHNRCRNGSILAPSVGVMFPPSPPPTPPPTYKTKFSVFDTCGCDVVCIFYAFAY